MVCISKSVLLLSLALPASAWGESTTAAPKSKVSEVSDALFGDLNPKYSLKGTWQSPMSWLKPTMPKKAVDCKLDGQIGGVDCSLSHAPLKGTTGVTLTKKVGKVCCKLTGPFSTKPVLGKYIGTISGSEDMGDYGKLCYELKSPMDGSGYLAGSIKVAKEIEGAMCTLETPPLFPPSLTASVSKKMGDYCVGVSGPATLGKFGSTASVSRTYGDSDMSMCVGLEGNLRTMKGTTGTATIKKKLGKVCANLEMKTNGLLKCTLDHSGKLAEESTEADMISIPAVGALIGLFAGMGITTFVLRRRGASAMAGRESLLSA
jgi:hypothetical protein